MTPEQERLNDDVKATFVDFEAGTRVYKWLEKFCFKRRIGFTIGKPDVSAYNEGHRDVIVEIDERIRRAIEKPPEPKDAINQKE